MIMRNAVKIIPLYNFKQPSRRYYQVDKLTFYEFVAVTYDIMKIPNVNNFRSAII
jgi:hypothetical protein